MPTSASAQMADHIRMVCRDGFSIDENTWHYLENTLSNPTPASVATILNDADDCESDSLMELVFYPDETMQIRLEPLMPPKAFTLDDQSVLINTLIAQPVTTTLCFQTLGETIGITMPETALRQFVNRLNLTYQLPTAIAASIRQHLPEKAERKARVRLRNINRRFSDCQSDLIAEILTKLDHTQPDYWNCVDFGLSIVTEVTPQTPVFDFFMDKKKYYFQSVQKAEQFMERLHQSNMETLMMQGERAVHIHPQEGRRTMAWIDQICRALFGHSDHFQTPRKDGVSLDRPDSRKTLSKIIDYLS